MSASSWVGVIVIGTALGAGTAQLCTAPARATGATLPSARTVKVLGSGVDLRAGVILHSESKTPTGVIQKSTEVVELNGDLHGKVLYQVTTVVDSSKGTLINTGDQVYSGTIAGSEPVMIHDNRFRFEVNLATGAEHGSVYLLNRIAGPEVRCTLDVVGTGKDADGNSTFDYRGECTFAPGA
jgi:hypothetical protein